MKAYWDYQRKIEYNREILRDDLSTAQDRYSIEICDMEEMFDDMWSLIDSEDYVKPPKFWIPKDEKYQIEGESEQKNIRRRK